MKTPLQVATISAACLLLGACSTSYPVVAHTSRGDILTGKAVASLTDGSFDVTDKKGLHCHGKYDQYSMQRTLTVYVSCSNSLLKNYF